MSIISSDIQKAKAILENEELVAIPTETVYGLAGNIFSEKAIKSIFNTKQRPLFNPLIVHISSVTELPNIVKEIPKKAALLAHKFWPGSLTLVLEKNKNIPDLITAGKNTVAVRIPNHKTTLALLAQLSFPLAAPSANPFNRISPTKASHVAHYFKDQIQMVLEGGQCKNGIESTIIGFENDEPVIYRLGAIAIEEIEKVVGKVIVKNLAESNPNAPGMLKKHYAPRTKTILTSTLEQEISKYATKKVGVLSFHTSYQSHKVDFEIVLSPKQDLKEAAGKLYDAMHQLDLLELDIIIIEKLPNIGLGKSMNDRLQRASF